MRGKILFITYDNPFVRNTGDSIYTCNILDGLFALGAAIDIIYYDSNNTEAEIGLQDEQKFHNVKIVKFKKKNPLKFIFSTLPGMIVNRKSHEYLLSLNDLLRKNSYHTIFLNHQKMMFAMPSLLKINKKPKLIYTSHNVEYLLSLNLAKYNPSLIKKIVLYQDANKTKWFEKKWVPKFDVITAISEHDADFFSNVYKVKKVQVLRPIMQSEEEIEKIPEIKKVNNVIIAGSFEWKPKKNNLLLFLNANNFPLLLANGVTLTIVGRADPTFVDFINKSFDGVHMTGGVPNLSKYYEKSKIAVIPERLGGGFKLKIVEAALHRSAIFSIKGAITKCNFVKGKHFIEKDTFEELISEIIKVQNKPQSLDEMIEQSYSVAKKEYTMEEIKKNLKEII